MATRGYIKGGPEAAAALAKLRKSMSNVLLATATAAGAKVIADEWRSQVRGKIGVGPGTAHYVEAIGFRASAGDEGATGLVALTEPVSQAAGEAHPREYVATLEFGTSARPARPTLRPAFDASKDRAIDEMGKTIRGLVERVT